MFRTSFTLFKIRGIPIRVHWSLLLLVPYMAFQFALRFGRVAAFAGVEPGHLALPPVFWGCVLTLALLVSLVLHELAHSLVAIRFGGRVRSITLMLAGGVSEIEKLPPRASQEGTMAAVGPLTSLALALVLFVLHAAFPRAGADPRMGLYYLAQINLALGLFNLLPAFPMDGGRVLRAFLTRPLGRKRATQVAATLGRSLAVLLGVLGVWSGNVLLLVIALFVWGAAGEEASVERLRSELDCLTAADAAAPPPRTVELDATVTEVAELMASAGQSSLAVVDELRALVGVVRADDLVRLRVAGGQSLRPRREAIRKGTTLVPATRPLFEALTHGSRGGAFPLLVPEGNRLVEIFGPEELARVLSLRRAARGQGPRPIRHVHP